MTTTIINDWPRQQGDEVKNQNCARHGFPINTRFSLHNCVSIIEEKNKNKKQECLFELFAENLNFSHPNICIFSYFFSTLEYNS